MTHAEEKYEKFNHCIEEISFIDDKGFLPTVGNFCAKIVVIKLKSKSKDVNIKLTRKQLKVLLKKLNALNLK